MMFLTINCTIESCQTEVDQSKCHSHSMESGFDFLSCYKCEAINNTYKCYPFFTSEKLQKAYVKYSRGIFKEYYSIFEDAESRIGMIIKKLIVKMILLKLKQLNLIIY